MFIRRILPLAIALLATLTIISTTTAGVASAAVHHGFHTVQAYRGEQVLFRADS